MKTHISNLVHLANFELCCISSIHHLLSTNATKILVSASVLSCLDYCNSLQPGCPQYLLNKLYKFETTLLALSWKFLKLTISLLILFLSTGCPLIHKYNSEYKLTSLCNNCLSFNAPVYLTKLQTVYKPPSQLCSSSDTSILRHRNWFEIKTLKSRRVWKSSPSKNLNLCSLRLSYGHFYGNKFNFFFCTTTDWYHLSDNQMKAPTLEDFKRLTTTPSIIYSRAHSPLIASKLKVWSCDVWNQDKEMQHHKTMHRCIPDFISLHIFTSSSTGILLL